MRALPLVVASAMVSASGCGVEGDRGSAARGGQQADAGVGGEGEASTTPFLNPDAGGSSCGCPQEPSPDTLGPHGIAWADIECFCQGGCPTLAALQEPVESCSAEDASLGRGPYLRSGCGIIEYEQGNFTGYGRFQFDAATGRILAAERASDVGGPPCASAKYRGGTFVDLPACPDYSECLNCKALTPAPAGVPTCDGL